MTIRTVVLRVAALALLLLLALVSVIAIRTMTRLPDTVVYFVRTEPDHFRLEGVHRRLRAGDLEDNLAKAIEVLAEGPAPSEQEQGLTSVIPEDTKVLELELDGRRLHVDLSGEFERGGGTATMLGRLYQLLYTLTQPAQIDDVSLSIEGSRLTVFGGEGIIVANPWARPAGDDLPVW